MYILDHIFIQTIVTVPIISTIRVAFNAKNDTVVDYLDIKKSDILSIESIDPSNIEKL